MRRKIAVFLAGGILRRARAIAVIASLALLCFALMLFARRSSELTLAHPVQPAVISEPQSGTAQANGDPHWRISGSSSAPSLPDSRRPKPGFNPDSILSTPSCGDEPKSSVLKLAGSTISAKLDRLDIEGGLLTVSWGAADGFGPLDVVNPRDYSDQRGPDFIAEKIAQPMLHGSYALDRASKIEAVFVYPNARSFDSANAGLRFTSSVGPADFGVQYFCGTLPKPAAFAELLSLKDAAARADHARYSQLGANLSSTIGSTTVRGEIAAHIADDLPIADGNVRKPAILWSVGTAHTLAGGANLNAQYSGSGAADTMLSFRISKKLIEDRLSLSAATLYDIESPECLMKTAMDWTMDSCRIELSGGVYAGFSARNLRLASGRDYVKFSVAYDF